MKTILVACGSGVVTSVLMNNAVQDLLRRNGVQARIIRCRLSQMEEYLPAADLVITSASLQGDCPKPVVQGTALLAGRDSADLERQILDLARED